LEIQSRYIGDSSPNVKEQGKKKLDKLAGGPIIFVYVNALVPKVQIPARGEPSCGIDPTLREVRITLESVPNPSRTRLATSGGIRERKERRR
jgi:hypothetical protein